MDSDINYSTIYTWFDKCGVISNIRTQLRQNLVQALKCKDTTLNQCQPRSAKQYVYDLLVAEYLLKSNYAYTLSVFTSEAPLPGHFDQTLTSNNTENNGKLQNDYIQHTLESLGLEPQESKGNLIVAEYADKDVPLLICILQCLKLCLFQSKRSKKEEKLIKLTCRDEATQTDEPERCEKCKNASQLKQKLIKQKEEFDELLKVKSEKLKEQALTAEQQLILLQEKMQQAQNLMRSLIAKEKHFTEEKRKEEEHMHQKKMELLHKEEFLNREVNRLETERGSYKQFEENLQKLQGELTKIKRGLSNSETKANCDTRDTQVQTDFQSFTMDLNEKELLNREKQDLSSLVREQQRRIKQLTHRAVQLSRQLEEAQLTRLNGAGGPSRILHTSSFISEGSSTEDILQDAKIRLKRLEEESIQAEKQYNDYILKASGEHFFALNTIT